MLLMLLTVMLSAGYGSFSKFSCLGAKTLLRLIYLNILNFLKNLNIQNIIFWSAEKHMSKVSKRCCDIEAVVTVDEKGQIVIPKDVREKAGVKPNDKLAIIGFERDNEICCIIMIKTEKLGSSVNKMLDPLLKDVM